MGKDRLNREIWAVMIGAGALLITISLVTYHPGDPSLNTSASAFETRNRVGFIGAYLADLLLQGFGFASYLLPVFLCVLAVEVFRSGVRGIPPVKAAGLGMFLLSVAVLLDIFRESEIAREAGGIVGGFLDQSVLVPLFGRTSATLISLTALVLSLMLFTQSSILEIASSTAKRAVILRKAVVSVVGRRIRELRERRESRRGGNARRQRRDYTPPPILLRQEVEEEPAKKPGKKPAPPPEQFQLPAVGEGYKLPPPDLLDPPGGEQLKIDTETLQANSIILQRKLADFGVDGEVVAVRPGPVITMYEFKPAPGVKVRRIVTLADDLAMALRAVSVRILAPIPGESVVGIEIPNPRRETVFLREIIESAAYRTADSGLTLALGKDIGGAAFVTDLARMPHLLVAGATGTGKSVSINAMVLSILFRCTPQDVQFIMIDPKMLELTVYEGIPHLLVPVVTDPKKAAAALFWAMDEMDRRYRLMREKGARNIDNYNRTLEKEGAAKKPVVELTDAQAAEGSNEAAAKPEGEAPLVHERLPRIVIVIDELADLMMTVGRDIEEYITRLAQKARAAGIHLILATQRPSVDVITGLIKANFPARISFQVTSRVDSRTILDSMGAEKLLGNGDLLFLPPGTARLIRVHGAFVSDQEVRKVMKFIREQGRPRYRPEVLEMKKEAEVAAGADEYDEMYDQAVAIVTETQQASISMLQRRLRVGYNRAARMIEQMERDGVVGPADGAKPREVYARKIEG
ncbi:MAG TPA: DNA translocase FtsK 4TM domain-containing protein [candidate division Zixibacteria bacterium]|nr:DNA translocase FtsK 4TM domain-containing protein [candidate division Zixibacteria bacterium]